MEMTKEDTDRALNSIRDMMRSSTSVDSKDFGKLLDYQNNLFSRNMIYRNFTDEDGNFRMDWMNKKDKTTLNNLSAKIWEYELNFTQNPIYDEILAELGDNSPESLKRDVYRDTKGRWVSAEVSEGWYQNASGELFHYDGVVWDNVPAEKLSELEFLG